MIVYQSGLLAVEATKLTFSGGEPKRLMAALGVHCLLAWNALPNSDIVPSMRTLSQIVS
jgi:hypothetical protein